MGFDLLGLGLFVLGMGLKTLSGKGDFVLRWGST